MVLSCTQVLSRSNNVCGLMDVMGLTWTDVAQFTICMLLLVYVLRNSP